MTEILFRNTEDTIDVHEQDVYGIRRDQLFDRLFADSIQLVWSTLSMFAIGTATAPGKSIRKSEGSDRSSFASLAEVYRLIQICRLTDDAQLESPEDLKQVLPRIEHLPGLAYIVRGVARRLAYRHLKKEVRSTNAVRGQVDLNRFLQDFTLGIRPVPFTSVFHLRSFGLPENQLVIACLLLSLRRIQQLNTQFLSRFSKSEAYIVLARINNDLRRVSRWPVLGECFADGERVARTCAAGNDPPMRDLLQATRVRIAKGLVRNPYYYILTFWVEEFLKDEIDLAEKSGWFLPYAKKDEDAVINKLFEFWLLKKLAAGFSKNLNEQPLEQNLLAEASKKPIFKFRLRNRTLLQIFFQKAQDILWDSDNDSNRWRFRGAYDEGEEAKPLGGNPDVSLRIEVEGDEQPQKVIIVDAKNRPGKSGVEEVYKMLGYFNNFSEVLTPPLGILVFLRSGLSEEDLRSRDKLYTREKGKLLSISVDPCGPKAVCDEQIDFIVKYCLKELLGPALASQDPVDRSNDIKA